MERKLHIGGRIAAEGWELFNIAPADNVDHVGNASDLSRFEDNTFKQIYASHVLEHFSYNGELSRTLAEWYRVLAPLGTMYISVPDLDILAQLFVQKDKLSVADRFQIMRMMFGGQTGPHDCHKTGFTLNFLASFLERAGFKHIKRVDSFGIFEDTSNKRVGNIPISLNVTATKDSG